MRYIICIPLAAALAAAGNAPAITGNTLGTTFSATLPDNDSGAISGAVKGASAPDGTGTNFQVVFNNLPGTGNLSYTLNSGRVSSTGDCGNTNGVIDPFSGAIGASCKPSDEAACQVGDLSGKHGDAKILSGGSGTGYFAATFVDNFVSMTPGNKAFFGDGSLVITNTQGSILACANFTNPNAVSSPVSTNDTNSASDSGAGSTDGPGTDSSSTAPPSGTLSASTAATSNTASASSSGAASNPARVTFGVGIFGLAAALML